MTSQAVPSTMVKCLYLFFDLPEMENPDEAESGNEFTPRERRILLQKIFVQVSGLRTAVELPRANSITYRGRLDVSDVGKVM